MRWHRLARSRALIACAIGGFALLLSGCGTSSGSSAISGDTLTIWLSATPSSQATQRTRDVLDAEELAFRQLGTVSGWKLRYSVLNAAKLSDNARTAIQDSTAIAYIGEILPGESADSLGIVNGEQILQVSPTDTAVELTQTSDAVPGAPGIYYETTGSDMHTFARVVPTTKLEADALTDAAQAAGVSKLYVTSDGQPYGATLATLVRAVAPARGLSVVSGAATTSAFTQSGAQALLFAGSDPQTARTLFDAVAQADPSAHLFAPSALADSQFTSTLSAAAQKDLETTEPGFLPADLSAAGRQFTSTFASTYGHEPDPEAIFGYEAVASVIAVLREAKGAAGDRSTVIHDYFALKNRSSVLGTYSIDSDGDTNLGPFVVSRVSSGRLAPFRFISTQG